MIPRTILIMYLSHSLTLLLTNTVLASKFRLSLHGVTIPSPQDRRNTLRHRLSLRQPKLLRNSNLHHPNRFNSDNLHPDTDLSHCLL